jgi:hypothetical protein
VFPHDAFRLLSSLGVCVIAPSVRTTYNSQIPYSLDDGPLWAGRGWNTSITAGLAGTRAMGGAVVTARAAPTLVYSQNLPFQVIPASISGRSSYANPFHPVTASIDMPLRFGDRHLLGVDPGRSSVEVRGSRVMGGITSENEWWGPAIRNSLVMSDHGPGIPRLYVATASPWHSRAGDVHAKLISGLLTESLFFD